MRNELARTIIRQARIPAEEGRRGTGSSIIRTHASRIVEMNVADTSRLPARRDDTPTQDPSGRFYFVVGYSAVGGDDVVRP